MSPPHPVEKARSISADTGKLAEPPSDVDRSLIRYMLSLTPLQRLEVLEDFVSTVETLRERRVVER